ncbi:hypothetical protein BGZ61DRAFT_550385 [Ilyonectria robusta]|uniref:uncharacterized protein n=1 Tax=Ilyonectria robusta TaxID=1079257 RepID=UPI001E8E6C81|nr:uncharacterized protein BGZ61DRAFT_550385 [Ilyonectria robusta]KAH8683582.1 hypothetical protein BGZ61DRAFT_550385 [Ilyonectria robusta]
MNAESVLARTGSNPTILFAAKVLAHSFRFGFVPGLGESPMDTSTNVIKAFFHKNGTMTVHLVGRPQVKGEDIVRGNSDVRIEDNGNRNTSGSEPNKSRGPNRLPQNQSFGNPSCLDNKDQSEHFTFESIWTPRFIGGSNPEARLFDETTTPKVAEHATRDEVGLWIQPRSRSNCTLSADGCSPTYSLESKFEELISTVSNLISEEETITVPSDIHFADVHPITPLLNEKERQKFFRV